MSKLIPVTLVDDGAMYASAAKIHPRETDGRLQRLRIIAVFWLLGMFYVFPWMSWGDRQMVLFDLPARKFYIFSLSFWPQDFFYLSMLLMMAAFSLFFFTALAGRLWCGYACPQTVWTEVFLWMERWTEGTRNQRIKLDAAPWTRDKILRKSSKQVLWVSFALWTGFTFVGFFTPIRELAQSVLSLQLGGWEIFWVLFYGLATYGNAGYLREQVCMYMCPYARFQGAMFDRNTLIIAYDERRGEPRGSRRKGVPSVLTRTATESTNADAQRPIAARVFTNESIVSVEISSTKESAAPNDSKTKDALAPSSRGGGGGAGSEHIERDSASGAGDTPVAGASPPQQIVQSIQSPSAKGALGDCIDCTICVQVCPTGIDIRNGLQYECIACGACIDACDAVMDKMDYPRGLIRYSTLNAMNGRPSRVLRPRIVIYAGVLFLLASMFAWSVWHRVPLIVDVLRDRNALYRATADGSIENSYTLKVMNKDQQQHRYHISIESALTLAIVSSQETFEVAAEQVVEVPFTLRAAPGVAKGANEIVVKLQSESNADVHYAQETRFFGPF